MTNESKFKTPEERAIAFYEHCKKCPDYGECVALNYDLNNTAHHKRTIVCATKWLALEAVDVDEVDPMPCPFCGGKMDEGQSNDLRRVLICGNEMCGYITPKMNTTADAIAAHNRVCKAVKAAKESEVAK